MSSAIARAVEAATRDIELRLAAEEERELELTTAERWARDPVGWINEHVTIASRFSNTGEELPGRKLRPVRMRLFPDQVATIEAWLDLKHLQRTGELIFRNVAIEKSRQIGETWVFAAAVCWALHHHTVALLAMHTKGGKIDDGGERNTPESLFGRVRYVDRHLDRGRLPYLPAALRYRPFSRDPAKIENPGNGAMIVGEGQTDNPGRGSTFDGILGDEFAFVEHGEKVYAALDEACPDGKALFSTVNGDDNAHARICDEKPLGWTYLRLHWSTHPVYSQGVHIAGETPATCQLCAGNVAKVEWNAREPRAHRFPGKLTSPWYDKRVIGKTLEQVSEELDIDREGALGGRVFREFSSPLHVVEQGIPWDPQLELQLAWDYGLDATSVIFLQDAPDAVRAIGIVELGDLFDTSATPERVAQAVRDYATDVLGVPAVHVTPDFTTSWPAVGDPAGHSRDLATGRPWVLAYRRLGFVIGRPPSRSTRSVETSINSVKRLLLGTPKPLRICGVKADELARHMRNNTWPTDVTGRRRLGATRPEDDVHNHACRALAYWAVDRYPPVGEMHDQDGAPLGREESEPDPLERRRRQRNRERTLPYGSTL